MEKKFEEVWWEWGDIKRLKPEWSKEQCENLLASFNGNLERCMIEAGWDFITDKLESLNIINKGESEEKMFLIP